MLKEMLYECSRVCEYKPVLDSRRSVYEDERGAKPVITIGGEVTTESLVF